MYIATKKNNEKAEQINVMTRELEGLGESLKVEIHIDLLKRTLQKYRTGGHQDMMEYMVFG